MDSVILGLSSVTNKINFQVFALFWLPGLAPSDLGGPRSLSSCACIQSKVSLNGIGFPIPNSCTWLQPSWANSASSPTVSTPSARVTRFSRSAVVNAALIIRCCSGSLSAFITKDRSILRRSILNRLIDEIDAWPVPKPSRSK